MLGILRRTLSLALVGFTAIAALACTSDELAPLEPPPAQGAPSPLLVAPDPQPRQSAVEGGYQLLSALPSAAFDRMVAFVAVPGEATRAVVLTQDGVIWGVSLTENIAPWVVADLRARVIPDPKDEDGLLGFTFSPNFATDRRVYVFYTEGQPRRNVLARYSMPSSTLDLASEERLLVIDHPRPFHNGGQLAFGPDGHLYVGVGDGGGSGDPDRNGQNLGTLYGKILRLDVSGGQGYAIPPDNPFVTVPDALGEIYAYGFRNPWRFSFDAMTGDLWVADVGESRWEEIDRVVAGGNYGWSEMEGPACFREQDCPAEAYEPPRAVYGHDDGNCAVIGGPVYYGRSMPELQGWLIFGDYCTGRIWALDTRDERRPPKLLLQPQGVNISSFGVLPNGEVVVVALNGAVLMLRPA